MVKHKKAANASDPGRKKICFMCTKLKNFQMGAKLNMLKTQTPICRFPENDIKRHVSEP